MVPAVVVDRVCVFVVGGRAVARGVSRTHMLFEVVLFLRTDPKICSVRVPLDLGGTKRFKGGWFLWLSLPSPGCKLDQPTGRNVPNGAFTGCSPMPSRLVRGERAGVKTK